MQTPKEVPLSSLVSSGHDVPGLDVGEHSGWTGNKVQIPAQPGGIRIIADGHVIAGPEVSLNIAPGSGFVEIVGGRIVMGNWKGVGAGQEKLSPVRGDVVRLVGTTIEGDHGTFGIHSRNVDLDLEDVTFDAGPLGQHDVYHGGFARHGIRVRNSRFNRASNEALKVVYRPWESGWTHTPRTRVLVEDTTFRDFSSGIVLQGCGSDVELRRLAFYGDRAILIDDGLSGRWPYGQGRYWDHRGVAEGPGAATGRVLIEDVAIEGSGRELIAVNEIIPMGSTWEHSIMRMFELRRCGLWNGIVNAPQRHTLGSHRAHDNNTPEIRDYCRSKLAMKCDKEASINA